MRAISSGAVDSNNNIKSIQMIFVCFCEYFRSEISGSLTHIYKNSYHITSYIDIYDIRSLIKVQKYEIVIQINKN